MYILALGLSKRFDVSLSVVRQREDIKAAGGSQPTLGGLSFCPPHTELVLTGPSGGRHSLPVNPLGLRLGDLQPATYKLRCSVRVHSGNRANALARKPEKQVRVKNPPYEREGISEIKKLIS